MGNGGVIAFTKPSREEVARGSSLLWYTESAKIKEGISTYPHTKCQVSKTNPTEKIKHKIEARKFPEKAKRRENSEPSMKGIQCQSAQLEVA